MSLLRKNADPTARPNNCACMTSDGRATNAALGFSVERNPEMLDQHEPRHVAGIERLHARLGRLTDIDVRAHPDSDEHHAHPVGSHACLTDAGFIQQLRDNKAVLRVAYTPDHANADSTHVVGMLTPDHLQQLSHESRVSTEPALNHSSFSLRCNQNGELVGVRVNRGDPSHQA